jgi:hypothetical protein
MEDEEEIPKEKNEVIVNTEQRDLQSRPSCTLFLSGNEISPVVERF